MSRPPNGWRACRRRSSCRTSAPLPRASPDLVVEMAHPAVTRQFGEMFLQETDYMPLSMTAFADEGLQQRLLETARRSGTCLFIPHGAVVGLENIFEGRDLWEEVTMVMKKSPKNLDFSAAPQFKPAEITKATVLYDGPTRAVCPLFPRNVNSHATVALAGIGFDRTRSVLIADPSLEVSVIEITAQGKGRGDADRTLEPAQGRQRRLHAQLDARGDHPRQGLGRRHADLLRRRAAADRWLRPLRLRTPGRRPPRARRRRHSAAAAWLCLDRCRSAMPRRTRSGSNINPDERTARQAWLIIAPSSSSVAPLQQGHRAQGGNHHGQLYYESFAHGLSRYVLFVAVS